MRIAVLTASVDPEVTRKYWSSWKERQSKEGNVDYFMVWNSPKDKLGNTYGWEKDPIDNFDIIEASEVLGVVPAFYWGLRHIVEQKTDWTKAAGLNKCQYDLVILLHDDVKIYEQDWDRVIAEHFEKHPRTGLAGFGGAKGIGDLDIYYAPCDRCGFNYKLGHKVGCADGLFEPTPYDPYQLARVDFASNMKDAETHGRRITVAEKAACFDGFCQIGEPDQMLRHFKTMFDAGIVHHFYDTLLGALNHDTGLEAWTIPIACHHAGGVTAVANKDYQDWAATKGGDEKFWKDAHKIGYELLRDILPIRIE